MRSFGERSRCKRKGNQRQGYGKRREEIAKEAGINESRGEEKNIAKEVEVKERIGEEKEW